MKTGRSLYSLPALDQVAVLASMLARITGEVNDVSLLGPTAAETGAIRQKPPGSR